MDRAETGTEAPTWAHLDKLRLGKFGEYFAKMAFVRAGLDTYSPEVDDRAIDALVRIPGLLEAPPRFLEIQVKTVRLATPGYVYMKKRDFAIRANNFLALVCLAEGAEADLYLVPALVWRNPAPPFVSRDYEGKKSKPEHGLPISAATLPALRPYSFRTVLPGLLSGEWPSI